jgi:hypothetical protein
MTTRIQAQSKTNKKKSSRILLVVFILQIIENMIKNQSSIKSCDIIFLSYNIKYLWITTIENDNFEKNQNFDIKILLRTSE